MLPSSWQRSITEKLRKRSIPINWLYFFNNIRRCAIWKIVEEQLHLPAAFVELGDGEGVVGKVVGEKHQPLAGLRIVELDPPQWLLEALARIVELSPALLSIRANIGEPECCESASNSDPPYCLI